MFWSYKKKWKQEKESKDKSRGYIQKTHDIVIKTESKVDQLEKENEKVNTRLDGNDDSQEKIYDRICDKIENHTCSLSLETESIVSTLVTRTDIQNGHLAALEKQGDSTAGTLNTLLAIAQGRRSLWKELGIIMGSIVGMGMLVFAGLMYWK
jgi:hypothetical protein